MKSRARLPLALAAATLAAAPPPAGPPPAADLYELGRQLFDDYAPDAIKAQFDFPTPRQWDEFAARLQSTLEGDSLPALAGYLPEARAALAALRLLPDSADYAGWLEARLDELEAAQQLAPRPPGASAKPPAPSPIPKIAGPSSKLEASLPHYAFWLARVRARPAPARAAALLPRLHAAFAAEGVPPALVWLAEAESSFDPAARSPAGAKGLFQLMPATARALGLGTFLPDERTDPEKSARAAARELRALHARFGSWPLALAAYNAGAGRVSRALAARRAHDYAAIADTLPAETRLYVPKVLALVATRAGLAPDRLPPPRG